MIYPLLYALSRVLPTPVRYTFRARYTYHPPTGAAPHTTYGPRQRAWVVWWRGRVLWTAGPPWTRTARD